MKPTIPGAWRGARLVPFDPERLLSRYAKKEKGVLADKRFVGDSEAEELGKKVAQITESTFSAMAGLVATPVRKSLEKDLTFLKESYTGLLSDMATLKGVTEKLVEKGKEGRKKRNNKNAGDAWELVVEDLLVMVEQREQCDVKKAEGRHERLH